MPCNYCGLPTDGGTNHGTSEDCIHALLTETQRLRKDMRAIDAREAARRADVPSSDLNRTGVRVQRVASSAWR